MIRVFLVLFAICTTLSAEPRLYKYLIEGFPNGGKSCNEVGAPLLQAFKTQTKMSLAEFNCPRQSTTLTNIEIRYTAERRAELTSTVDNIGGVTNSSQGSFHTMAACESAIGAQRELFTRSTMLTPIVAYCYQESREKRNAFALRIEAFGRSQKQLILSTRDLFGAPIVPEEQLDNLEKTIVTYAQNKIGNTFGHLALRTSGIGYVIRLLYYRESVIPARVDALGTYSDKETCKTSERDLARQLSTMRNVGPIFCVHDQILAHSTLNIFQLREGEYFSSVPYPKVYAKIEDCVIDRPNVLKEVAENTGKMAVASVCSQKGREVVATALVKY